MEDTIWTSEQAFSMPVPNGIFADTGQPLPGLDSDSLYGLTVDREQKLVSEQLAQTRDQSPGGEFAVLGEIDAMDLAQAGWGIIFSAEADPRLKEALFPLLARRKQQAGSLFKVFEGAMGYRPQDSAMTWLERRDVRMDIVDPSLGVPYYLLLVGSPEQIPFDFQYTLDIYWAVGRLYFEEDQDDQHYAQYRQYAESIVAYETATSVQTSRQIALFATCHDGDAATQLFLQQVANPLVQGVGATPPLGQRQKFQLRSYLSDQATKATLRSILQGIPHSPALLLTGSHGIDFRPTDSRQTEMQGALICQDWEGYGSIQPDHWFASCDVPQDAKLHGLIHFFFACYSAGWPPFDTYNRPGTDPRLIATKPSIARLPQRLLSHPNGSALAVLGHIDRAWAYSFRSRKGSSQTQGFRDVIGRLLRGERIGQATDQFNIRWTALSTELLDYLRERDGGTPITAAQLATCWVARDDARNYIILGDPAVQLRTDAMPELSSLTS